MLPTTPSVASTAPSPQVADRHKVLRLLVAGLSGAVVLGGCTQLDGGSASSPSSPAGGSVGSGEVAAVAVGAPDDALTRVTGSAAEQALAMSGLLWDSSRLAVVASEDDSASVSEAAQAAVSLSAPLLLSASNAASPDDARPDDAGSSSDAGDTDVEPLDPQVAAEIDRLGVDTVVYLGAAPTSVPAGLELLDDPAAAEPQSGPDSPGVHPPAVVLATPAPTTLGARASAEAAGATVVEMRGGDPRDAPKARAALSSTPDVPVVAAGGGFGSVKRLAPLVATASSGVELPGGGQTLFPGRRLLALYGHPQTTALGVLGEQSPQASVERARQLAGRYEPFSAEPVVPAFEIIATVASADAGSDGNYSNETPISVIRPYVDAAAEAGVYVVLDLQPGRTDFVTQAKLYRELLVQPHVGLALDPEWRLGRNEVHLRQIGTVSAAEVDRTADWLARLVRTNALPQKLLLLHQFQQRMITDRATLDATRDEVVMLVQMDGDGTPGEKLDTWQALQRDAPDGLLFGWKNFYDEDTPTFSPKQTMAVIPQPWWVSYQ